MTKAFIIVHRPNEQLQDCLQTFEETKEVNGVDELQVFLADPLPGMPILHREGDDMIVEDHAPSVMYAYPMRFFVAIEEAA